jgi:hypothetical protein
MFVSSLLLTIILVLITSSAFVVIILCSLEDATISSNSCSDLSIAKTSIQYLPYLN